MSRFTRRLPSLGLSVNSTDRFPVCSHFTARFFRVCLHFIGLTRQDKPTVQFGGHRPALGSLEL